MIICIMCLGIESNNQSEDEDIDLEAVDPGEGNGFSKVVNCFLALGLALCGAVLMSTKHFIIRLYSKGGGYSGFDQSLDASILEGTIMCFFLIPLLRNSDFVFTWLDLSRGTLAGIGMTLGRILIAIAVAEGIAGPAQALMSTHALWQSLWTTLFAS